MTNRHPIDELYDVRAQIAALKLREEALRDTILRDHLTEGDEYRAEIITQNRVNLDRKALSTMVDAAVLDLCSKASAVTVLKLRPL